jgi:hypothetical protein
LTESAGFPENSPQNFRNLHGFVSRWSARAHLAAGLLRIVPGVDMVLRRTFRWALPAGAPSGQAAVFLAVARTTVLDAGP